MGVVINVPPLAKGLEKKSVSVHFSATLDQVVAAGGVLVVGVDSEPGAE
jgi:hypothetical protein